MLSYAAWLVLEKYFEKTCIPYITYLAELKNKIQHYFRIIGVLTLLLSDQLLY